MFPLYPKLRLTALELTNSAGQVLPFFKLLLGAQRDELRVELAFVQAGRYLRNIYRIQGADLARMGAFARTIVPSRYIGRMRFFLGDGVLADVVCDTTDIARDVPRHSPIIGVLPFSAKHIDAFRDYAKDEVPWAIVV